MRYSSSARSASSACTPSSRRGNQVLTCEVRRRFSSRSRSARRIRFSCEAMLAMNAPKPRPDGAGAAAAESSAATSAGETSGRRLARSTAFFSFATGLSRVLGLVREVVAASYFGVSGAMSAFTIAFQVPNLMRALFADSALQGAFVPVFTELLEKGRKQEAFRVASGLFSLITMVLGGLTVFFWLIAPLVMPVFSPGFSNELQDLTVQLARIMFPLVWMLAISGVVVGMLNSFEHFSVPALAPIAWNLVIIASLVGLAPALGGDDEI